MNIDAKIVKKKKNYLTEFSNRIKRSCIIIKWVYPRDAKIVQHL